MKTITKLKVKNFRRFKSSEMIFNDSLNILIGDNESGKSSILQAINIVISGNRSKVENIGLESLFNVDAIESFMTGSKRYVDLPVLHVELYLNEQNNYKLNGQNNSDGTICDGMSFICKPNDDYSDEIKEILIEDNVCFPFEYYSVLFQTFSGQSYTGYRKFLKKIFIDNSAINNEYAAREYIKDVYDKHVTVKDKAKYSNEYRRTKANYVNDVLESVNEKLGNYSFDIKTDTKSNLNNDLSIKEGDISIVNMGQGKQCFIKTEFALANGTPQNDVDVLLLEEPENHLSHINMYNLIDHIHKAYSKQMFITTHSNMISTRLDLRKTLMLSSNHENSIRLNDLPENTAKYFMKSPDNTVLEYILSKKVILVEGDAEYILFEDFFRKIAGKELNELNVHVISVGGTSFKRYLDIGRQLGIKTAVVRDNDEDYQKNCVELYRDYIEEHIKIFSDMNSDNFTFEVNIYNSNKDICDDLFGAGRRTLSVLDYMLKNKAEVAFELLDKRGGELAPPEYIKDAITWIIED